MSGRATNRWGAVHGVATRRSVLVGAGLGLAGAVGLAGAGGAAAVPAAVPPLPGEVARAATRTTRVGRKRFETVDVALGGDRARLYVPWGAPLQGEQPGEVLWFYPSFGSDHTSLDGAYSYGAMLAVDQGVVCVCPGFGNALTSEPALEHQVAWSVYVSDVFSVGTAFSRANSGGGALMTYAYGRGMVPAARGVYLANAAYDVEDLFARDPARVGPLYGGDPAAAAAGNPARLPQQVWTGKRIKVVTSPQDEVLPPAIHGLGLAARAEPVATDVRRATHAGGHRVPAFTNADMISTFRAWL